MDFTNASPNLESIGKDTSGDRSNKDLIDFEKNSINDYSSIKNENSNPSFLHQP
jgi:hypothetical protein